MTNPASIVRFSRLMLASIVLSLIQQLITFDDQRKVLASNPQTAGLGDSLAIFAVVVRLGLPLLLWFMITKRASNVAKWILVAVTAIVVAITLAAGTRGTLAMDPAALTLAAAVTALHFAALWFLFRPDARAWLGGRAPVDPDTFN